MTYDDNPELVRTVLEGELDRQWRIVLHSSQQLEQVFKELEPLLELRDTYLLQMASAEALVEGLKKTLGIEDPPVEEDPHEAAFETTPKPEGKAPVTTFADDADRPEKDPQGLTRSVTQPHRAPMLGEQW